MDEEIRKATLNIALKKAMKFVALSQSELYQSTLLPYLKELSKVPYINPEKYKSEDEMSYALFTSNMRAGVYSELISFIESQNVIMNKIREQLEVPKRSNGI